MSHLPEQGERMDLNPIRERLKDATGPQYWRSLEELSDTAEFQDFLWREFPSQASEWLDDTSRRNFLRVMGASLALAGVSGCAYQPPELITPYVRAPEQVVPGKPQFFASTVGLGGYGTGVLVESHMGRPIKVEGNEAHPASLGSTDTFLQASILGLYDPDRSATVVRNGRVSTWNEFVAALLAVRSDMLTKKGEGLRILSGASTSPTLARLLTTLKEQMPEARWHVHEPVGRERTQSGSRLAFGQTVDTLYALDQAQVIVALGADFLGWGPAKISMARDFASQREPKGESAQATMNRLFVAETTPSITGASCDHRVPATPQELVTMTRLIASGLGVEGIGAPEASGLNPAASSWVEAVIQDLGTHKGSSVLIPGDDQPAEVHALAHAINAAIGAPGKTVNYISPVEVGVNEQAGSLAQLIQDITDDKVEALLVLESNPVYSAAADLEVADAIEKVKFTARLGLYEDETSEHCKWHVPAAHPFESWGDLKAFDGTVSLQQPLIAPLYSGKSDIEVISALIGEPNIPPRDVVRATWGKPEDLGFEQRWKQAVHDGLVADTASQPAQVELKPLSDLDFSKLEAPGPEGSYNLSLRPDPTIWDGQFSNNGWLQELPKPLTKLTWDNPLLVSLNTAQANDLKTDDMVEISYQNRTLQAAVWVMAGQPDNVITLTLGYGRSRAGRVGTGTGFNAYALRTENAPWGGPGATLRKVGAKYPLASTQLHWNISAEKELGLELKHREILREGSLETFRKHPDFVHEEAHGGDESLTLYPPPEPQRVRQEDGVGNAWAMVINLNTCIGCSACVVACQAENNIPVVGKEQVLRQREMHWIRIDHYFKGSAENPKVYHAPVPCMHCEKAPCELVCPVAATTHSAEGLNEMTYNRCVGTRYCSNNCPYKVRRFNFFQYSDLVTASLKLQRNPDVTVRTRGIMEKCTYCVQRINGARINAEKAGRTKVLSKEVVTACQGACPTRAIVFGNLNDLEGELVKAKQNPRNYSMLTSLNVRPRTTYLAKLTNPNPDLAPANSHPADSKAE